LQVPGNSPCVPEQELVGVVNLQAAEHEGKRDAERQHRHDRHGEH
jgi:hypothetical protein